MCRPKAGSRVKTRERKQRGTRSVGSLVAKRQTLLKSRHARPSPPLTWTLPTPTACPFAVHKSGQTSGRVPPLPTREHASKTPTLSYLTIGPDILQEYIYYWGVSERAMRLTGLVLVLLTCASCARSHDVSSSSSGATAERGGTSEKPDAAVDEAVPDAGLATSGAPTLLPELPTPDPEAGDEKSQQRSFGLISDPPHPISDQDELRHYEVVVDPQQWARINDTAYLEEYIEGKLMFEGAVVEPVGLRFKGFRGSLYNCFWFDGEGKAIGRVCDRLSLKLSFNEYDPEGRFYGLKKLNFHAMNNDRSKLRERLSYWLFRQFGVPAPRSVHATLSVNGQPLGLFALVEQVDGRFTRARFNDGGEGNLYKQRWPMSSTDPEYFMSGLKTNEHDEGVSVDAMVSFAEALQDADEDSIEATLAAHTDLDAMMRFLAVDRAVNHWDGITAFRCRPEEEVPPLPPEVRAAQTPPLGWEVCQNKNFYWYEEGADDGARMWLVAWDTDLTFASRQPFPAWDEEPESCPIRQSGRPPGCDPLIRYFATTLRERYVEASVALLDGPFDQKRIERRLRRWWAQIEPHMDPPNPLLGDLHSRRLESFITTVADRRAAFAQEVGR